MFVEGYANQVLQKRNKSLSSIDLEKLNILHWCLYYDKPKLLSAIFDSYNQDFLHIGRAVRGSGPHMNLCFELSLQNSKTRSLKLQNLGLYLCLQSQSKACLLFLCHNCPTVFNSRDIEDGALVACNAGWKDGVECLVELIEQTFSIMTISRRKQFVNSLLEINGETVMEVLKIGKIQSFFQWMC